MSFDDESGVWEFFDWLIEDYFFGVFEGSKIYLHLQCIFKFVENFVFKYKSKCLNNWNIWAKAKMKVSPYWSSIQVRLGQR